MTPLSKINHNWTLFLDRDGVINVDMEEGYILSWEGFEFLEGSLEAIRILSGIFGTVVIATNQRGIGKGLMTEADLTDIHTHMLHQVKAAGGRIDKIYHCASLDDEAPCRKPNIGMAHEAKSDFPEIEFTSSVMVGNRLTDMGFARNGQMLAVFIASTNPEVPFPHPDIDYRYDSLYEFALAVEAAITKT
ncbi:HAD-IIIA family hydrolase [Segetibacter sp. 3557_3]|uniref:D-glycero-alpha-D-manno-heptose-1,7-bisphosphate 7-phosphatase n=1 Tax=Segetibacter sp. 3557_3 TaxID=2547429 RepID=UPI001058A581|nr:HAD-IIIA family hydrolase [Segetibacter sp. 3557_3]TDH27057.1 HAD-IIIA family hydrolase [Segetibacter sp. 3557_3]